MTQSPSSSTNQGLSKGWGILSQLIYPPLLGFGLGWLIEKKYPAQGWWMLGLMLLFFVGGLYSIVKCYLIELAEQTARKTVAPMPLPPDDSSAETTLEQ
jgi:F0F1-type ATP synthase assembly protein I